MDHILQIDKSFWLLKKVMWIPYKNLERNQHFLDSDFRIDLEMFQGCKYLPYEVVIT